MVRDICLGRNSGGGFEYLLLAMAARHGVISGVTGFGKTTTLAMLAKGFSDRGVPVIATDVKGDLSGIALSEDARYQAPPVQFYDVFGVSGKPISATLHSLGPILLARMLELSDAQTGVLNIAFHIANKAGAQIASIEDLTLVLQHMVAERKQLKLDLGSISPESVGTIQRKLIGLQDQGGDKFFKYPNFDINEMMRFRGSKGFVNLLMADKLYLQPRMYSSFVFWMLSQLFERLPEVGDLPKPKVVFFFDEAHLLFKNATPALMERIEQVIRLVRSKGVGVYFVTQSPNDIPDAILGQLSNRFQHALRAYTPKDKRMVKTAAESYRPNPHFSTEFVMQNLEIGDALVSTLDERGQPQPVQLTRIRKPPVRIGALTTLERSSFLR